MLEIRAILNKLQDVKKNSTGWQARCPAHDDRVASLSVAEEAEAKADKLYRKHLDLPSSCVQEEWISESDGEDD